nr:alpha/beta fold hydrolase [Pseudomonas frederiksbergensis]
MQAGKALHRIRLAVRSRNESASQYLQRLKERKKNRDNGPTPSAFLRQLKAITAWGKQAPQNLGRLRTPTLIVNGDNDIMVSSVNSTALANRIPNAQLVIYEDAGHGGIFQHYIDFVTKARAFLDA